jgi:hypothetical protein
MAGFGNAERENLKIANYEVDPVILKNLPSCISEKIESWFTLGNQFFMN